MKTVRVECEVSVPVDATDAEIEEWISYCFGQTAQLSCDNPLVEEEAEAIFGTLRVD